MSRRRVVMIVVLVGLGLLAALTWRQTRLVPAWYDPPDPASEQVVQLADRAEYRLLEEAQKIRPAADPTWTVRVEDAQVNAWLSARLPQWLHHDAELEWPEELGTPQVCTGADGIRLALPVETSAGRRVFTARIVPTVADGEMTLALDRLWVGRLGLPGEPITRLAELLREHAGDSVGEPHLDKLLDVLAGRQPIEPVMTLADERRVRLVGIRLHEEHMDLTCRTLPRLDG